MQTDLNNYSEPCGFIQNRVTIQSQARKTYGFANGALNSYYLFNLIRCSEDSEALLEYIRNNREELDNLDEDIFEAAAAIGEMKQLQEITEKQKEVR